jgi:GAF domain-containing protein
MDLSTEVRWLRWAPKVHDELGVCSMMSLLLYIEGEAFGSLNLYGDRGHAFDGDDLATAKALAGHVAVAMAAGRQIEGLGVAMASRTLIGQAEGILMERFDMDAAEAFAYLRRLSSEQERKLAVVAAEIAMTRKLPKTPRDQMDR